jgi:hypothetical protein
MDPSWSWGLPLIGVTIGTHVIGIALIAIALARLRVRHPHLDIARVRSMPTSVVLLVAVALCLAVLHGIEATTWALAYLHLGALSSASDAALYSVDSLASRGASGIVVERQWRMMGALEACDGMLLFGISTAFLFDVMLRLWKTDVP